jgi:hypothetical protein
MGGKPPIFFLRSTDYPFFQHYPKKTSLKVQLSRLWTIDCNLSVDRGL